jgi:hypothetical protein
MGPAAVLHRNLTARQTRCVYSVQDSGFAAQGDALRFFKDREPAALATPAHKKFPAAAKKLGTMELDRSARHTKIRRRPCSLQ